MDRIKPRTLAGFMELLPNEQIAFNKFMGVLEKNYIKYGFYPLDTPVLESAQVLLAKGGGETEKQIYRFKKGDTDLAMRFDLTVPLAKYAAMNYNELNFPFKRYQIGKVYRGERAQKGRFREFYQADIDIVGDGELSILNDAEIPAIIYDIFTELGIKAFKIRINNRKLLSGFFEILGFADKCEDILRTIDKLEKAGREKVVAELSDYGVDFDSAGKIIGFVGIGGTNAQKLEAAREYAGQNEMYDKGLAELELLMRYVGVFGVPEENCIFDFSIARGLDYYTGTVYETMITEHPEFGSVCSGGRYDNLAGFYTDKKLPGVGVSIGATRLFTLLKENGLLRLDEASPVDVLVIPLSEDTEYCIRTMNDMRKAGVRAQMYFEDKKLRKKMNYANKIHVPYVIIIGDEEVENKTVTLKNLNSGEQIVCAAAEAVHKIKSDSAITESSLE